MKNLIEDNGEPIKVLLVEDDPGDIALMKESFSDSKLSLNLNIVENGIEALSFLRKEGGFVNTERPDLILTDLNMPKMDGRELLNVLKNDPELCSIPVVVLTTSNAESDIAKSYLNGAACYVTKTINLDKFSQVVRSLENFWFTVVKFPTCD